MTQRHRIGGVTGCVEVSVSESTFSVSDEHGDVVRVGVRHNEVFNLIPIDIADGARLRTITRTVLNRCVKCAVPQAQQHSHVICPEVSHGEIRGVITIEVSHGNACRPYTCFVEAGRAERRVARIQHHGNKV